MAFQKKRLFIASIKIDGIIPDNNNNTTKFCFFRIAYIQSVKIGSINNIVPTIPPSHKLVKKVLWIADELLNPSRTYPPHPHPNIGFFENAFIAADHLTVRPDPPS